MLAAGKDPGDPKQNKKEQHGGTDLRAAARQMAARQIAARQIAARRPMGFENGTLRRLDAGVAGGR